MKCPICGMNSDVLETRGAPELTTKRRRECDAGHRFNTYEVYESAVHKTLTKETARAATNRVERLKRDVNIALELHKQKGRANEIGLKYGLCWQNVYLAARRGRAHLQRVRKITI